MENPKKKKVTEHNGYPVEHNGYPAEHNGYPAEHNGYPGLTGVGARHTCVSKKINSCCIAGCIEVPDILCQNT